MPNWCYNVLTVTCEAKDKDTLERFKNAAPGDGSQMSMERFVPTPNELLDVTAPPRAEKGEDEEAFFKRVAAHKAIYGHADWYTWRIANWGTKWDVDAELDYETETMLTYSFDSAWSPPVEFLRAVSSMYPALLFELRYEEPGMGFQGEATAQNGDVQEHTEEYERPVEEDEDDQ